MSWLLRMVLIIFGPEVATLLLHRYVEWFRRSGITHFLLIASVLIDLPFYYGMYAGYTAVAMANDVVFSSDDLPTLSDAAGVGFGPLANDDFVTDETEYGTLISQAAKKHGVDPMLFTAQIKQESVFDPRATSRSGAAGLGQLMPIIQNWCGLSDAYDPAGNLDCSAMFMAYLLDKYDGSATLALAAYNAGEPSVDRCNCVPQNGETPLYVRAINGYYNEYLSATKTAVSPDLTASAAAGGGVDIRTAGRLLYAGSDPEMTQGYHGIVAGWEGYDYAVACGTPLYSPVPGTAKVIYNGLDGYNHQDENGKVWPQATLLVVSGPAGTVKVMHGIYDAPVGSVVVGGVTRIGTEAQMGYVTGCHSHIIVGD